MNLTTSHDSAIVRLEYITSTLKKNSSRSAIEIAGFNLRRFIDSCLMQYLIYKGVDYKWDKSLRSHYATAVCAGAPKCEKFKNALNRIEGWERESVYESRYLVTRLLLERYTKIAVDYLSEILELDFGIVCNTPIINIDNEDEITKERITNWVDIKYKNVLPSQRSHYGVNKTTVAVNFYRGQILGNVSMLNDKESLDFIIKLLRLTI